MTAYETWERLSALGGDVTDREARAADEGAALMGYVEGVLDDRTDTLRRPEGFTIGQACLIAIKYFREHPERLQEDAAILVKDAIRSAYPQRSASR